MRKNAKEIPIPRSPQELAAMYISWMEEINPYFGKRFRLFVNAVEQAKHGIVPEGSKISADEITAYNFNESGELERFMKRGYHWFPISFEGFDTFKLVYEDLRTQLDWRMGCHYLEADEGKLIYSRRQQSNWQGSTQQSLFLAMFDGRNVEFDPKYRGRKGEPIGTVHSIDYAKRCMGQVSQSLPPVLRESLDVMVREAQSYQGTLRHV